MAEGPVIPVPDLGSGTPTPNIQTLVSSINNDRCYNQHHHLQKDPALEENGRVPWRGGRTAGRLPGWGRVVFNTNQHSLSAGLNTNQRSLSVTNLRVTVWNQTNDNERNIFPVCNVFPCMPPPLGSFVFFPYNL